MTLQERINTGHMTTYQWGIVLLATALNLLDGFDVLALAFTAPAIKEAFGLDGVHLGYLLSAGLVGMSIGSIALAPLADYMGRRNLLIVSLVLSAIGMFGSALSPDALALGICRLITGLGVGGLLVGTNVIVSEYSSRKWRSLAISIFASGFGVGALLGGLFAVALQGVYSWHSVFIAGGILTLFCLVAVTFCLPESIAFIQLTGGTKARFALEKIANKLGIEGEWDLVSQRPTQSAASILSLLGPCYYRSTLAIWAAFATVMFSYYFVSSWTPALLKEAGMTLEQSVSIGMMISLGGTLGSLAFGGLASRWSSKSVLIVFALGAAVVASVFIALTAYLWLAIVAGIGMGFLMNGCISGLYAINPSLYETSIRSTGVGTAIGVGRVGAILAPTIAGFLLDCGFSKDMLYMGVGLVMISAAVSVAFVRQVDKGIKKTES